MKREAKLLRSKSIESLLLAIELFNRPWELGRVEGVLIFLDRAFELILKAALVHKGGRIREPGSRETIGFDKCVRKCLSENEVKCLSEDQGLTIQMINSLRDAAQHYFLDISEQELYTFAQAGVTLYGEVMQGVFGENLGGFLPERVLPVSVQPPQSLDLMVDRQFAEIRRLVRPGSRKRLQARAKLRTLAIIEASLAGERSQPSEHELGAMLKEIQSGKTWRDLFPGVATLRLTTSGEGLSVSIRLTKSEGDPVHLVPEGTPGATIMTVKRVNELGFYSLSTTDLAEKTGLTVPKTVALVRHLGLQSSEEYYKEFKIGRSTFKRYSPKALVAVKKALLSVDMDEVWDVHGPKRRSKG